MIGEKLGGFAIEKKLGQGGMGAVFAARSERGEPCALKVLAPDLSGDEKARERFRHECRLLHELEHPRIVRALSGLLEEGERCFYAMELVDGEDLGRRVERLGPLPIAECIAIAADVLDALAVAHERGVLHRDVKPSNVFIEPGGRAKLGDFGVAFIAGATRLTRTGAVVGTPEFMAPEVANGDAPSVGTDLYAVGVLVFFMLEGRPPFTAAQPLAVLRKQIDEPAPPLARPVSMPLASVVARALAKKPEERFASARALRDALVAAEARASAEHAALAKAETRELAPQPSAAPAPVAAGPAPGPRRGRSIPLLVVALLLLAALANHSAPARRPEGPPIVIQLRDGSHIAGELVKLDLERDALVVRLADGTEKPFPLDDVASYEKTPR